MRRTCQGYCGGYVALKDAHTVGRHGEQFCPECYGRWLRIEYYGGVLELPEHT